MRSIWKKLTSALLCVSLLCSIVMPAVALGMNDKEYSFQDSKVVFHACDKDILLNEDKVQINGSVYAKTDFTYTGEEPVIDGELIQSDCEIPDYTDLINASADYDFTTDDSVYSGALDLAESSVYAGGSLTLDEATLNGAGNLTASGDILIYMTADETQGQKAIVMSETGDITINGSKFTFNGVLYAPNGKITINAKEINLTGGVYGEQIEINGTCATMKYADYLPDGLVCDAGKDQQIYIEDSVTLSASCNYSDVVISFAADESVTITDGDTLNPTLRFAQSGEYVITMTARIGDTTASDTVTVTVHPEPLVTYTSTEDFNAGTGVSVSTAGDKLTLSAASGSGVAGNWLYNQNGDRGISVSVSQSKNTVNSASDSLALDYTLSGYGQAELDAGNDMILLVDKSGSMHSKLPTVAEAAVKIWESMGPNDRLGVANMSFAEFQLTDEVSKDSLYNRVKKEEHDGSDHYDDAIIWVSNEMFDESSDGRDKYIIMLSDGINGANDLDEAIQAAKAKNIRVIVFEMANHFLTYSYGMEALAAGTKGYHLRSIDVNEIASAMTQFADEVYNNAGNEVVFATTVTDKSYLDTANMAVAPDSVVENADGSVTLKWKYDAIRIDETQSIGLPLKTKLLTGTGYKMITKDTSLTYYDRNGKATVVNLEDVVVGRDDYADNGRWESAVYDSGRDGCTWSLVSWHADYLGTSALDVYLSASEDGVHFGEPVQVSNHEVLTGLTGRYLKVLVELKKSEDGAAPVLYDLTVYALDGQEPDYALVGPRASIRCGETAVVGKPVTAVLDLISDNATISQITWAMSDAENTKISGDGQLLKTITFTKAGEYTLTADVLTDDGMTAKAVVNITVADQPNLDKDQTDDTGNSALTIYISDTPEYVKDRTQVDFKISFSDPSQVAWYRVCYNTELPRDKRRSVEVDSEGNASIYTVLSSGHIQNGNNGVYNLVVEAFDKYGNCTRATRTIIADGSQPMYNVSVDPKWYGYVYNTFTITINYSDDIGVKDVVFTIGGKPCQLDENNQYQFTTTVAGEYPVYFAVTDFAGNVREGSWSINIKNDTIAPNCSIGGADRVTLGNSIELTGFVRDSESGIKSYAMTVNGQSVVLTEDGNNRYKYVFAPAELGEYKLVLTAEDNAGNISTAEKTITCVADTNRPSVSVKLSNGEVVVGNPITVTVEAKDNVAVTEVILYQDDVEVPLSDDMTYIYNSDAEGLDASGTKYVTFKAVVRDAAGNESQSTAKLKVIKEDTVKPTATISCAATIGFGSNYSMSITAKDNIAVQDVVLTVNGEEVALDENGRYYFDTSDFYVYDIKLVVTDTAGNVTEVTKTATVKDTTNPTVSISRKPISPKMGDTVEFTVKVSDNHQLTDVVVSFDGKTIESVDFSTGAFIVTVENISAGTHKLEVVATDYSGNVRANTNQFTVKDTQAPTVELSTQKDKYAVDERPIIDCQIDDNVEVSKVEAYLNGNAVAYEDGKLMLPASYEPGQYTLTVKVSDAAGNSSEAECSFEVMKSTDVTSPVIVQCSYEPPHWQIGTTAYIYVTATDDSGTVNVTLWYGDTQLTYDGFNSRYAFTPDKEGYVEILIHAEDESGNYTEAKFKKYVYTSIEDHKLVVDAETVIPVGQPTAITLSSSDGFDFTEMGITCTTTGTSLVSEGNVFTFTADAFGVYQFTATGTDAEGITDTVEFSITAASAYEAEVGSSTMKPYLETTIETTLTKEMLEVVAGFTSPVDAYAYVVNNIRYDCYINSRRGGIGAFETTWGNDYDQSSLLIAFLREMGYPARYVSGNITLTEAQLNSLFGSMDYQSACQHFANSGRKVTMNSSQKVLKLDQVWVEVYVPYSMIGVTDDATKDLGVWVSLDPAIKASELKSYEVDQDNTAATKAEYDAILSEFTSDDVSALVDSMKDFKMSDSVKERLIIQQNFAVLPSALQYTVNSRGNAFAHVTTAMSDTIRFTMDDWFDDYNMGTYRTADLYNKRVSIQYTGSTGSATIFELGASAVAYNEFTPALTIDGEIVATGPATTLGNKQSLNVTMTSGGGAESFTDELQAGSMYAIVLNTGYISEQTYNKMFDEAIEGNGVINRENAATKTDYYREEQVCSFLALAGNFYFILDNGLSTVNAGRYNVEESCRTKCAVVGYDVEMEENYYGVYTKVLPGSFFIDVNLNTTYSVSREGDQDARNAHVFSSSMMGSFFEGFIWEYYLGHHGISTMHIFSYASEQGVGLQPIYDYNYDEQMEKLSFLSASTKSDIKNAVSSGYCVLIPEAEITMDDWSGTGYMIADLKDYNHFVYRISGGLNGGGASKPDKLDEAIDKGLTPEFFDSIGVDYDDFFCGLFGVAQILYGMLEIKGIYTIAGTSWGAVLGCSVGSIGAGLVSCQNAYDAITDFQDVVGYYASMLDSILVYTEDSIEGVQLLTSTVLKMINKLTGAEDDDIAVLVAKVLGVEDFEGVYGLATVKSCIEELVKLVVGKI